MQKSDLSFDYPPELIATERAASSRVMLVEKGEPQELSLQELLDRIPTGDVLVINDTKVIPARIFSEKGFEILFIESLADNQWQVLCPARKWPKGQPLRLPDGVELQLIQTGLPQKVQANRFLDDSYFFQHGDMPLPPYIQEARGVRRSKPEDMDMYQTAWAENLGSLAAPTASLHFSKSDLEVLKNRGVHVETICLHVGLGTFLPIHADNLDDHSMHSESVFVSPSTWKRVQDCKEAGGAIWALGSTVTRALESVAQNKLKETDLGYQGLTDLFIRPGFNYQVVDRLMTNFHQPESTLVAMVMAFAGVDETKKCYQWAIEKQFRLFSYGDLSVWIP